VPTAPHRYQRQYRSHQKAKNEGIETFITTPKDQIQLEWGRVTENRNSSRNGNVEAETRRIIVENVYPRILYAFSNVVVFVTSQGRYV
jgi:hypothetical protein